MAYMSQEKKAQIAASLKPIMPKSWKWSLAVNNHSTIVLTITSAPVDLIAESMRVHNDYYAGREESVWLTKPDHMDVNHYYLDKAFDGDLLVTFKKILAALNTDNHDNSDVMTDYFDVGHYVDIQVGRWNKPFVVK